MIAFDAFRSLRHRCVQLTLVLGMLAPGTASAFCRATTCDPSQDECPRDASGCMLDGADLVWKREFDLKLSSEGSSRRGISAEDLEEATHAALSAWTDASCAGGKHPSIPFERLVLVDGADVVFDADSENVIGFLDDTWPYDERAVAKTQLGFFVESGRLDDADIALNSAESPFALTGDDGRTDLQAVLTHELGHLLGLDHSDVAGATMQAEADSAATEELRTLEDDDVAAICAVYPPGEKPTEEPTSSSPDDGGCSMSAAPSGSRSSYGAGALLLGALGWRRRHARCTRRKTRGGR